MKFNKFIILFFVLGMITMSSTNSVLAGTMPMQQFDKSTMIKKKLSDAQNYIAKGDYVAAQKTLNSLLKLDPNNSKAKELLENCESGIKKQKQLIYQAYIDACNAGTISSLENFISKYPNSEYVSQAKKRIEDYNMWKKAKEQNTISAYNTYLSSSSILAYKDDAYKAIKNIQAEIEWNNCKNSNDEEKLNAFIQSYPSSSYINQANKEVPLGLQAIFANRMEHWAGDGQIPSLDSVRQFCFDYERTGVEYYIWQILHQLNTHPD